MNLDIWFIIYSVISCILVVVPAYFSYKESRKQKLLNASNSQAVSLITERIIFLSACIGALVLFANSCHEHNDALNSKREVEIKDSIAKNNERLYQELLAKKIDTGKNLITRNIELTNKSKAVIDKVETLETASQTLIDNVNKRTKDGLNTLISITSQTPQQRLLQGYIKELNDGIQMKEVIDFFISEENQYAFDRDSLAMLKTIDTIYKKFQSVFPSYLSNLDTGISLKWKYALERLDAARVLIKTEFGDNQVSNPTSPRRQRAIDVNNGIYEYFSEIYQYLTQINTLINRKLTQDKVTGATLDMYVPPSQPGDTTNF